jgi:hypothetical protein
MNIGESRPANAEHFPRKLALVDGYRSLTFAQFHDRVNRLLREIPGTGPGEIDRGKLGTLPDD